jgi:hypothetical protein
MSLVLLFRLLLLTLGPPHFVSFETTDQYCRLAESVVPAAATNDTTSLVHSSIGDVWLAELAYHQAAHRLALDEAALRDLWQQVGEHHLARRVQVWTQVERRVLQRPATVFGQLVALDNVHNSPLGGGEEPGEKKKCADFDEIHDDDDDVVNARLRHIAEFHGTTLVGWWPPEETRRMSGGPIDLDDTCSGEDSHDTTEEEEKDEPSLLSWSSSTDRPRRSGSQRAASSTTASPVALDKTFNGYANFMDKLLFTPSVCTGTRYRGILPLQLTRSHCHVSINLSIHPFIRARKVAGQSLCPVCDSRQVIVGKGNGTSQHVPVGRHVRFVLAHFKGRPP